jgi:hypothetical protein
MDWEKAEYEVNKLGLPELIDHASKQIIQELKTIYKGQDLLEKIMEIKSCSTFVFDRALKTKSANRNHILQNFHYLFGSPFDFGSVTYICKDDCRILEFPTYKSSIDIQVVYQQDISTMTDYYVHKELPPKEKEIIFDEATCRFSKNIFIEYSYYLTKLYKYATPREYADKYKRMCADFNGTFKRCVNGDRMTDLNKQRIIAAKKLFPEWDRFVVVARERGILEPVEEDDMD